MYQNLTFYEDFWKMNRLKAEFPTSGTFSLLQSEKLWICKRDFFSRSLLLEIQLYTWVNQTLKNLFNAKFVMIFFIKFRTPYEFNLGKKKASKNVSPSLFAFGTKCILQFHCVLSNLLLKDLFSHLLNHGQSSYWTAKSSFLFFFWQATILRLTQITP